jgi:hypothetical protein
MPEYLWVIESANAPPICGELAGLPMCLPRLLQCGIRTFNPAPPLIPVTQGSHLRREGQSVMRRMAERAGFEPAEPVKVHTLSKRAQSATLTPLQRQNQRKASARQEASTPVFNGPSRMHDGIRCKYGSFGKWWWGKDSNLRRRCQQIYSLPSLST